MVLQVLLPDLAQCLERFLEGIFRDSTLSQDSYVVAFSEPDELDSLHTQPTAGAGMRPAAGAGVQSDLPPPAATPAGSFVSKPEPVAQSAASGPAVVQSAATGPTTDVAGLVTVYMDKIASKDRHIAELSLRLHELEAAAAAASSTKHPADTTALSKHPTTAVAMHQATDSSTHALGRSDAQSSHAVYTAQARLQSSQVADHSKQNTTAPESFQLAVQVQDRPAESPTASAGGHALGQQHHPDTVDPTASIRLPVPDQVMLAVQPPAAVREVKEEWQQRLESQIAELRRQLESDAQERTQMLVAAAARARALEDENKQLLREKNTELRLSTRSASDGTRALAPLPAANQQSQAADANAAEAAQHIEMLTAELREERSLLAMQRKEREVLENNLCESKLMVESLSAELARAKAAAAANEKAARDLAGAQQDVEEARHAMSMMERRLAEVEAELKTAILDRANVRSQERQTMLVHEETERQRRGMSIAASAHSADLECLRAELSVALRDKNKAESALKSAMEEVQMLKGKLADGRWQQSFPNGASASALAGLEAQAATNGSAVTGSTRLSLGGVLQRELDESRTALEKARQGVEEIKSKLSPPSAHTPDAATGQDLKPARELELLERHNQQVHQYQLKIKALEGQMEAERQRADHETQARQASDDLNAELLEKLHSTAPSPYLPTAIFAPTAFPPNSFSPRVDAPAAGTQYLSQPTPDALGTASTPMASVFGIAPAAQQNARCDDTLEKVKRALLKMKSDV